MEPQLNGEPLTAQEESLDPTDWEAMRQLGRQMVEEMVSFHETVRERPVWQAMPEGIKAQFGRPLPVEPEPLEDVYAQFAEQVLPYLAGNTHPRFWGWVLGTGTVGGMLADMLAAGTNANLGGGEHAPVYVETQVLRWCAEMVGFPAGSSGLLVSGASMANLVALTVARDARAGFDIQREGLQNAPQPLTVYCSVETHSCVDKAMRVLGLGDGALRKIPVNKAFEMDLAALEAQLAADRTAGMRPIAVVGNAGTVNTGAYDDLDLLADLCAREGLWFHVDGAFGALAALAPDLRHLVSGLARADSVAFDMHKWMYLPYEIGVVMVRDEPAHRRAFSLSPDYLAPQTRGLSAGPAWFSEYGVQLSRGFRALKAWMALKEHGVAKYGRLITQNVAQARYLARLVQATPELTLMAPVPLNIVCFRYTGTHRIEDDLNAVNEEILLRLHEQGLAVPSYTKIGGAYTLRAAITNHRSRREDFELLVREVVRLGREVVAEGAGTEKEASMRPAP